MLPFKFYLDALCDLLQAFFIFFVFLIVVFVAISGIFWIFTSSVN